MDDIDVFLSYSDKDKIIAKKLADKLESYNFSMFLAHENLTIGTEWEDELKNEIYNCELFLVLLSENFKTSNFTNHEVGIATAHNKRIFQIRIDNTEPYGFMYKFHAEQISPKINSAEIQKLVKHLTIFTQEGRKIINELIEELSKSGNFRDANTAARKLSAYPTFTSDQLNNIANAYIENFEVSGSWTAGPYVSDLLLKRWNQISSESKDRLRSILRKD